MPRLRGRTDGGLVVLKRCRMVWAALTVVVVVAAGGGPTAAAASAAPSHTGAVEVVRGAASTRSWTAPAAISPFRGVPSDVSCPTSTWCLAVDHHGGTLRYSGGAWHREQTLAPAYPGGGVFHAVSCPTTTFCLAVVYDTGLAEWHGPGSVWTVTHRDHSYTDVACWSGSSCAVLRYPASGTGGEFLRWYSGTLTSPVSTGSRTDPRELTCPTSTCHFLTSKDGKTYAQRVSGTSLSAALLGPDSGVQLSCSSATSCMAVAYDGYRRLSGGRWTAPQKVRGDTWILDGPMDVDCRAGTSSCVVVGSDHPYAIAAHWNGHSFTPRRLGGGVNTTRYIDCASATSCMAVDLTGAFSRWTGSSWTSRAMFDASRGGFASFDCVSVKDCVATDEHNNVLQWNGSSWSRRYVSENTSHVDCAGSLCMTSAPVAQTWRARLSGTWGPTRSTNFSPATDIVCAHSKACFSAIGRTVTVYNGSSWSSWRGLPVNLGDDYGISGDCPSSTFCMLVGAYGHTTSWDGSRWVDRGSVPADASGRVDIDCLGRTFCIARSDRGAAVFTGSRWRPIPAPADGQGATGMGCLSSTECYTTSGADLWRWDGAVWSPDATGVVEPMFGAALIRCVSGSRCFVLSGESVSMTT